jgi:zinc/manganese transport system permease protein
MNLWGIFVAPFLDYAFMARALAGAMVLALSAGPVGVCVMLRRMSRSGDAMAHAIRPGPAVGFLVAGLEILPMTLGGFVAGLVVALLAGLVSRATIPKEDTSLAAFYLISLSLGVLLVSLKGTSVDLMHVLFGTVLALDDDALTMIGAIASISLVLLAVIWRPLVAECLDPGFLRSVSRAGQPVHLVFLGLVVINLVGGFQALGTLLAVGLMMLPAAAARFWVTRIEALCLLAVGIGMASSYLGLVLSFQFSLASGPAIILVAGAFYLVSLLFGTRGIVRARQREHRHRTA